MARAKITQIVKIHGSQHKVNFQLMWHVTTSLLTNTVLLQQVSFCEKMIYNQLKYCFILIGWAWDGGCKEGYANLHPFETPGTNRCSTPWRFTIVCSSVPIPENKIFHATIVFHLFTLDGWRAEINNQSLKQPSSQMAQKLFVYPLPIQFRLLKL